MPAWLRDIVPGNATAAGITAALIALGVVLLLVAVVRRRSPNRAFRAGESADGRIGVVEWSIVDERRRLLLVRRDGVEHLVMIGGPSDLVIEANIGARNFAAAVERPASPRPAAAAAKPAPAAQNAAAVATLEQAALAYAPAPAAEGRSANAQSAAVVGAEARSEQQARSAPPKPRPPLAAVPAPGAAPSLPARQASDGLRRNGAGAGEPARPMPLAAEADRGSASARRPATRTRKEPSIAGAASRWAGNGQVPTSVTEAANMRGDSAPGLEAANDQNGWSGNDEIENEISRALSIDPFPPLSFPGAQASSGQSSDAVLKTSGSATVAASTLGDLAEKLEDALAREVRSSQGRPHLDLDLDAFTGADRVQPAAPAVSPAMPSSRQPEPEPRREPPAPMNDDPPVISLSSRRRDMGDPIEDEMARLLGELTDGARR